MILYRIELYLVVVLLVHFNAAGVIKMLHVQFQGVEVLFVLLRLGHPGVDFEVELLRPRLELDHQLIVFSLNLVVLAVKLLDLLAQLVGGGFLGLDDILEARLLYQQLLDLFIC